MNEIPDGQEEIPNAFTCQMADGTVFTITNPNWQRAYELRIPVDKRTWFTDLVVESSRAIAERTAQGDFSIYDIQTDLRIDGVAKMYVNDEIKDLIEEFGEEPVPQSEIAIALMYQYLRPAILGVVLSRMTGGRAGVVAMDQQGGASLYSDQHSVHIRDLRVLFDEQGR